MTGVMSRLRFTKAGLDLTISGSFHFVIWPVKILQTACRVSLRFEMRFPDASSRLYMNDTPPALTGTYTKHAVSVFPAQRWFCSCGISPATYWMSEAPKSKPEVEANCWRPKDEPCAT